MPSVRNFTKIFPSDVFQNLSLILERTFPEQFLKVSVFLIYFNQEFVGQTWAVRVGKKRPENNIKFRTVQPNIQ